MDVMIDWMAANPIQAAVLGAVVWLFAMATASYAHVRRAMAPPIADQPPVESERLSSTRRLLREAAQLIRAQRENLHSKDPARIAEAAWLPYITVVGFLDKAFYESPAPAFQSFLETEKDKLGDTFDVTNSAAQYLERLAARVSEGDLDARFLLPASFSHFDPNSLATVSLPLITKPVAAHQWREMSDRFRNIPSEIRADFHEVFPLPGHTWQRYKTWRVCGGRSTREAESLCAIAGAMLKRSARIFPSLPQHVQDSTSDMERWLEFIEHKYGRTGLMQGEGWSDGVKVSTSIGGHIEALGSISATACIDCEAREF